MADEELTEETENEQPEEAEGSDPTAAEEPAAEPGSDPSPEGTPEPAADKGSDPTVDGEGAAASPKAPAKEKPAPAAEEDPEAPPTPKQIRKRRRSEFSGEAKPPRSNEERAAERVERRRQAAKSRSRYRARQREKRGEAKTGTPPAERQPADRKVRQGIVVSSKGDKTITVKVEQVGRHRRYEKVVRRSRTMHAHDESNQAHEGDVVRIVETRPLSRTKRWRLVDVVERAR